MEESRVLPTTVTTNEAWARYEAMINTERTIAGRASQNENNDTPSDKARALEMQVKVRSQL